MFTDLHIISETFSLLSGHVKREVRRGAMGGRDADTDRGEVHGLTYLVLSDPHDDADAWIAATDEQRIALRVKADAKHAAAIRENAYLLGESIARANATECERRKRWRDARRDQVRRTSRRWRENNRTYFRDYMRQQRASGKSAPEGSELRLRYEKELQQARARKARLRAAR